MASPSLRALPGSLPTGRNGRLLAVLIALLVLAVLWLAIALPLLDWHATRAEALAERRALADRMTLLVARLPAMQARAQALRAPGRAGATALIAGNSDAVASAEIQEKVASLASSLGLSLASTETLAAASEGSYRRVGVRVSMDAGFEVVVRLLGAIEAARPSLLIDDLQIHGTRLLGQTGAAPLNVAFTVIGYRRPDAAESRRPAAVDGGDSGPP
ncbi:type II secretion system protein GspM [Lichenicoccus sp.]|uniref:type II secretion system protein GspM n=1 Tax=Lichenicoccus sp. TaxID=2781899 RepID=UPI003D110FC3